MELEEKLLLRIGAKIKKLRIEAGYTSHETFATDHELSRVHYGRMEGGKVNMTIKSLAKILKIHKISIEDFFKE